MATTVDLNCDMGESFGAYKIGLDEEVAKYISSAKRSLRISRFRPRGYG